MSHDIETTAEKAFQGETKLLLKHPELMSRFKESKLQQKNTIHKLIEEMKEFKAESRTKVVFTLGKFAVV